ncbi:hypothetical protein KFE25_008270 [Diacronema lutheri]|uniref:Uncharacterized protein n=1 Tax=Diacronema lutheri TaxID=2081491 RepID=A0A8J5XP15_DIALT|nr:hypothetical protein KFE25_008270 [Diacronema lutheri]
MARLVLVAPLLVAATSSAPRVREAFGRRALVASVGALAAAAVTGQRAARADVQGDLLRPCERIACVSSQDDRPVVWDNPWEYADARQAAALMQRLRDVLAAQPGCEVVEADSRYVRAVVNVLADGSVRDELEFYLTPDDVLVQFRAQRSPAGVPDLGANRQRVERLRKTLGLAKLPVLRDRTTRLWFESPLDQFGPAEYDASGLAPLGR